MIFAEIDYPSDYADFHPELLAFVGQHFSRIESGLQGDSWIWIMDGGEKVALDTFTAMKHQVKSRKAGPHVEQVIETLRRRYAVKVYAEPVLEGHED